MLEHKEPCRLTPGEGSQEPRSLRQDSMHHGHKAAEAAAGTGMFENSSKGAHSHGVSKRNVACQTDEQINPDDYPEVIR